MINESIADIIHGKVSKYEKQLYNTGMDKVRECFADIIKKYDIDLYNQTKSLNNKDFFWFDRSGSQYKKEIENECSHCYGLHDLSKDISKVEKYKAFLTKQNIPDEKGYEAYQGNVESQYLYHYTSLSEMDYILMDNEMMGNDTDYGYDGVSFTTKSNLHDEGFLFYHDPPRTSDNLGIIFKIDFNKIKADGYKYWLGDEFKGTYSGEAEIRIKGDVKNITNYINQIIILPIKLKNKGEDYRKAVELCKKYNINYKLKT